MSALDKFPLALDGHVSYLVRVSQHRNDALHAVVVRSIADTVEQTQAVTGRPADEVAGSLLLSVMEPGSHYGVGYTPEGSDAGPHVVFFQDRTYVLTPDGLLEFTERVINKGVTLAAMTTGRTTVSLLLLLRHKLVHGSSPTCTAKCTDFSGEPA